MPEEVRQWKEGYSSHDHARILPMHGDFIDAMHDAEVPTSQLGINQPRTWSKSPREERDEEEVEYESSDEDSEDGVPREFEGLVRKSEDGRSKERTTRLLREWYNSLKPADSDRGITIASPEFRVSRTLITEVRRLWIHLLFHKDIRIEPSTINTYGPGSIHDCELGDTQPDLLGTVFVGLGDTSASPSDGLHSFSLEGPKWLVTHATGRLGPWWSFKKWVQGDEDAIPPQPRTERKTQLAYALVLLPKWKLARKRATADDLEEGGRPK
ncbi:hypothetical protein B0H17DRAFT_1186022 [Mycena rosella]|uniref:Uncharacterized protein n=1 Tax=Mycena rosella TaxID=1033263 RepID=A0AAD7G0S8_MYCRO|nr:hypothetical protein B0H17DRAFT_1186022 [Mycena rosella]